VSSGQHKHWHRFNSKFQRMLRARKPTRHDANGPVHLYNAAVMDAALSVWALALPG
jgi:hypothetical protein